MANLEKLVKALEALKVFQPGGVLQEDTAAAKYGVIMQSIPHYISPVCFRQILEEAKL